MRTGPGVGKTTHRGIIPLDTPESLSAEFSDTWKRMRGEDGMKMRVKMQALREAMRQSWSDGESRKAMLSFDMFL